jgi:cell division protein FtsA
VADIVFTGLASSYATLTQTEKELGCVLVDIGSGTTSICAFVDGALAYSGAIPVGARNVTNDLAIGLRVSLETAERIKINLNKKSKAMDKHGKELVEVSETGTDEVKRVTKRTLTEGIIKPRLTEIFSLVKSELDKTSVVNKVPSGLVITGGGAMTVGIDEVAKRVLALPIRIAKPKRLKGLIDDIMSPEFATGVGLIMYGVENMSSPQPQSKLSLPSRPSFNKLIDKIKSFLP